MTCLAIMLAIAPAFGCIGLSAQILNVLVGQRVKAQYDGLKKQRVAIVVTSGMTADGPDYSMELLSRLIKGRLQQNIKEVELIPSHEIANIMDYKGRAMYSTRVYDIESGEVRFNRGPINIAFPESGQPVTDTNAIQFEKTFLNELSYRISRYFYDYAIEEEFGRDAILSN